MTLRADDGTPLEAKEGIVLDQQGQPLTAEARPQFGKVRSYSFSLPVPALIGAAIFIPVALAIGATFFVGLILLLTVLMIVGAVSRFLKNP
jgi:hypothetical protein